MVTATLERTVESLGQRHDPRVLAVASMAHLSKGLLKHYGQTNSVEMAPVIKTLDRCIESYLIENDIHPHALSAALTDLQHAGTAAVTGGTPA